MNYLKYVNIKQGSKSTNRFSNGNTLPLVQLPFGFASFCPQTHSGRGNWYYHPEDRSLEGIRLTHQPSPWIGDHAAISFLPQIEKPLTHPGKRWSGFDPENAVLEPSYMEFYLKRSFSTVKLTPTEYGAVVKISFDKDFSRFLSVLPVDGYCAYKYNSNENSLYCETICDTNKGYDKGKIKAYFIFRFSDGDVNVENTTVENFKLGRVSEKTKIRGKNTSIHLALNKKEIEFKVSSSYISYEQARLNLERDVTYESFEDLKNQNEAIWNEYLSRIEIEGNEEQLKTFYSCMYRVFLYPHKAYEIDENGEAIHYSPAADSVRKGVRYTDNGFWDTYRTVYPLYSIIAKDEFKEILEGFIQDYIDGAWLPCWTAGDAKNCMPSTAIDAVICDAATKGLISEELLKIAFKGMELHANENSKIKAYGRDGCEDYLKLGYVPCDKHRESVNLTLDAAYFDYCLSVVAGILGYEDKKQKYLERSKNYANIFDSETGFMRPKDSNGNFKPDFDPVSWGGDYTEAAAWQTTFAVQHDFEGYAELLGGTDKLVELLDRHFNSPVEFRVGGYGLEIHEMTEMAAGKWGQCAISNQPSFHIPFIYTYLGENEKCAYWIKRICEEGFSYKDDGFPGDEDNGTTAAWYIFATIGLYPITPGKPIFTKTTPLAENIKILGNPLNLKDAGDVVEYEAINN